MNIQYTETKHLKEYADHLKGLSLEDRYTRFCHSISNAQIDQFILSVLYNPASHHLFTAEINGKIVGFAHFAQETNESWELAVSVDTNAQGQGIANKLMAFAISWAKIRGIRSMFMHCINDNKKIQHLAVKHNLKTVDRSGGDITAHIDLPSATFFDYLQQMSSEHYALLQNISQLNLKFFRLS